MHPAVAPLIGAGANLLGDWLGKKGQDNTNIANAQQAKDQMAFQERMSNTSYQRGVDDLKKAGLNPALAYSQGGASSPGGAQATMANPLAAMKGSAKGAAETFTNIAQNTAQVAQTKAQTELTKAETTQLYLESQARAQQIAQQAALTGTNARLAEKQFGSNVEIRSNEALTSRYNQRLGQVNLERGLRGWERDRDLLWPLEAEQMRQNIRATMAGTRDTEALARLRELGEPTALNLSRAANTFWGRNITPFLPDAKTMGALLTTGATRFR